MKGIAKNIIKIWCIGCTHAQHEELQIPSDIDMVIHTGDESNYRSPYMNLLELNKFLQWYSNLNIKHKIFIAGNHSAAIYSNLVTTEQMKTMGITYLENETVDVDGLIIHGNPYTPEFGNWYFNKKRDKMSNVWDIVPNNVDILISHGPAKGFLDLSFDHENYLERTGCQNLTTRLVKKEFEPILLVHSHIHDSNKVHNYGTRGLNKTIIANVSICVDGKFGEPITHHGIVFTIQNKTIINTEIL